MDVTNKLLVGRPYGGTVILYRRGLARYITDVNTLNSRISVQIWAVLLVCVYMPADYGDSDCLESYVATCSAIESLISQVDAVQLLVTLLVSLVLVFFLMLWHL